MSINQLSKKIVMGLLLVGISIMMTGCWDRLEIEDRAVVLAIAVDKVSADAEKKEEDVTHVTKIKPPEEGMFRVALQIAVPGRIPLGPTQGGGGGTQKPVWILSAVGHTIDDAIFSLQQQVSSQLFFGHLRVIIISQKVAESGVENLNDYLRRNSEVRRAAWMVVSKGESKEVIELNPQLERVPALYLLATLEGAVRQGKLPNDFLGVFWSAYSSKGQDAYLPYIEVKEGKNIMISGLAYFNEDRMVGKTKPIEIGHFMAIKSINPGGYSALSPMPGSKTNYVMLKATDRESKIKVDIKDGKPAVHITSHIEVNLMEKNNENFRVASAKDIKKIQDNISRQLNETFLKFIKDTQEKGSDIFGFGEIVRGKHSKYWDGQIKTKKKWEEIYRQLPVDVHVEISVRRVGMKAM